MEHYNNSEKQSQSGFVSHTHTHTLGKTDGADGNRREEGEGGAPGLSKAHSWTKTGGITVWRGAGLLKVTRERPEATNNARGKRGEITGFSRSARRRMMQELNKIRRTELPVYLVLTFPDEYYQHSSDGLYTRKLWEAFKKRLIRRFPGCGAVYRREFEDRKSGLYVGAVFPHYNVLVWGVNSEEIRAWLPAAWWEVCGQLSADHLRAGTYAKEIESRRQMYYYVSKYVAKMDGRAYQGWGKWWGYINRSKIPWAEPVYVSLNARQSQILIRYARRKSGIKRNLSSITLMTENPDFWYERLAEITV